MDWAKAVVGQLDFYWDTTLAPRLEGLTDAEYVWEPVPGCWSVRPGPDGAMRFEVQTPAPEPPPVTTIAWRMVHVAVGVFRTRASCFFGDGSVPADATMFDRRHIPAVLPATAAEGRALLEHSYRWWRDGIAGLDAEALHAPLGPRGGPYFDDTLGNLALHLNREAMHHGGEMCLLRDLYRDAGPGALSR